MLRDCCISIVAKSFGSAPTGTLSGTPTPTLSMVQTGAAEYTSETSMWMRLAFGKHVLHLICVLLNAAQFAAILKPTKN